MRHVREKSVSHRAARGFTLVEVSLAVAIAGLAAGWGLWSLSQSMEMDKARMQGSQLAVLGAALSDYSQQNFAALAAGSAVAGFANATQPTVAELRTAGFLDPTFSANSLYQTGYTLRVTRSGPCSMGATTPGCNVTSVAALSAPMQFRGQTAWASLGEAMGALGAQGGFSAQTTPTVLSGVDGSWTSTNPVGAAGVLAYRDVYGQSDNNTFLRRDGTFPMTGNLQMAGNSIRGGGGSILTEGGSISTAGGAISAGSGSISGGALSGSSLSVAGSIVGGSISGSALSVSGGVTANSVSASAVSATNVSAANVTGTNVTASGTLQGRSLTVTSAGSVVLTGGEISGMRVASVGGGCSPAGALSVSSAGELLSCQGGRWRRQSTNADGGFLVEKVVPAGAGCGTVGEVARSASGELLSCQSGIWKSSTPPPPPPPTVDTSACIARNWGGNFMCPANYVLAGANYRGSDSGEWNTFYCCPLR